MHFPALLPVPRRWRCWVARNTAVTLIASNAVTVAWVVAPSAPPARVTGAPATPSRSRSALLHRRRRWGDRFNGRSTTVITGPKPTPPANPDAHQFCTPQARPFRPRQDQWGLPAHQHAHDGRLELRSPVWLLSARPAASAQRSVLPTSAATPQTFTWDGRNDSGTADAAGLVHGAPDAAGPVGSHQFCHPPGANRLPFRTPACPGGYLARSRGTPTPVAAGPSGRIKATATSRFTRRTCSRMCPPSRLTSTTLSQENPRTDGRYVVWQGRQVGGNWEIYLKDLSSNSPAQQITSSARPTRSIPSSTGRGWSISAVRPPIKMPPGNSSPPISLRPKSSRSGLRLRTSWTRTSRPAAWSGRTGATLARARFISRTWKPASIAA